MNWPYHVFEEYTSTILFYAIYEFNSNNFLINKLWFLYEYGCSKEQVQSASSKTLAYNWLCTLE